MIFQEVCTKGKDYVIDRLTLDFIVAKLQSGKQMTPESLVSDSVKLAETVVEMALSKRTKSST